MPLPDSAARVGATTKPRYAPAVPAGLRPPEAPPQAGERRASSREEGDTLPVQGSRSPWASGCL
eukprot:5760361-Alexandrium_andersonii.AAC.1